MSRYLRKLQLIRRNSKKVLYFLLALIGLLVAVGLFMLMHKSTSDRNQNQPFSATDKAIGALKNKLAVNPGNITLEVNLCQNYLQKVRETADTSYFAKCDHSLNKAIALEPNNANIISTQAAVFYGRHNFSKGLELSQKAMSLNPNQVAYYGLVGDGQIELGQYEQAVASFQTMINKRPSLSSFNRVAYIRELYGDVKGAQAALKSAVSSGSSFPENIAYSQVELGKLYARNDLNSAEQMYKQAVYTYKDFSPALEGLGKVAFARGNYNQAISYFNQAFDTLPLAQYATDLGDGYSVKGDSAKANQQYFLADLAFQKSSSGGVNNDFEKSVFLTDHNKDLSAANRLSREAVIARPNIFSADILAWNLYKTDKYEEAQTIIQQALRLGENQPVILFHAGMIADKLGQHDQAKTYLQKAFSEDHYFLESHFSLLDKKLADGTLKDL